MQRVEQTQASDIERKEHAVDVQENSHGIGRPGSGSRKICTVHHAQVLLGIKQQAEGEVATASRTAPVPYTQSDDLAIYRFGQGEPLLFMPYPHAASVMGDPM